MNYNCILKDNEKCLRGNPDAALIPIHPEHLYFFEVGKEYEQGVDFEIHSVCDGSQKGHWERFAFNIDHFAATPLPASPVVEEDTPVLFADWIIDNHFTKYNNIWTSTKIHYSGAAYTTEQLYKLFESYNITKK